MTDRQATKSTSGHTDGLLVIVLLLAGMAALLSCIAPIDLDLFNVISGSQTELTAMGQGQQPVP